MTLSSRIAGLTSASREIDAEIADLLGWWPITHRKINDVKMHRSWRCYLHSDDALDCPNYTANIMHVFAECNKRGWFYGGTNESCSPAIGAEFDVWDNEIQLFEHVHRTDRNVTLAACEAIVRAVENNANDA